MPGIAPSFQPGGPEPGIALISPSVYGCRGAASVAATGPLSTTLPAYMTVSRWNRSATTARS